MNRLVLVCLIMVAIFVLAIIVFIVLPQLHSNGILGPNDPAINIALADPNVEYYIAGHNGNYRVNGVVPEEEYPNSGFFDVSDTLVVVNMTMMYALSPGSNMPERFLAFVDLNQSKVVDSEMYSYRDSPGWINPMIPPGGCYYHILSGIYEGSITQLLGFTITKLDPENATVYPIIVDETNLSRMKAGKSYEPAIYIDTHSYNPAIMNGTVPVYTMWSANATFEHQPLNNSNWPYFDFSQQYYIVLKNPGPSMVGINIIAM